MIDFIIHISKTMAKSLSQKLVRLQENLKLTEDEKNYLHILKFLLYFTIFQYTNHHPISVADLG